MSGRQFFSDTEKICLQELIIKYKLNSTTTTTAGNQNAKKLAWSQLVVEFNSIETNSKRTEAQLKKCWDNLKTRKKTALCKEKKECMKTGGGSYDNDQQETNQVLIEEALLDQTDTELQFVIDSDYVPPTEESVAGPSTSSAVTSFIQEPTQAEEEVIVPATSVPQSDAQDGVIGVSTNQGAKNIRATVIRNEFEFRKTLYDKKIQQEDELHQLKIREQKLKNIKEHILIQKARLEPERIISPYTNIIRRSGNPFELAVICTSWLIGAGYDAYVAVGCAKRDVCMAIRYRTECPDIPDEREVVTEEPPPEEEPRYRLVPLPDLTSKYVQQQEEKAQAERQKLIDKAEHERLRKIAELEKPPPDDIDGWRIHGWSVVLPGPMGVEEPFFIEPSEGNGYPVTAKQYQRLDSLYNHENYYVNLQSCASGLGSLSYDLSDLSCWEHLLAGEPYHRRQMVGIDVADKRTAVDTEKHLDMPASWVEKLDVLSDEWEQRYPGSYRVIHYKKVLLEKFSQYSQRDGIVKRVKIFEDYALTVPVVTYEWYNHRLDKMETVKIDFVKKEIRELFGIGRHDHLLKHVYAMDAPPTSVEAVRTLEFNYYARLDHLTKLVLTPTTFDEHYTDRSDRLETRLVLYSEATKSEPKRQMLKVTETYSRNPEVPAKEDVWKRIFHLPENKMELLYHYEYNFVTNNTRSFIKPNLVETGGKILYFPDQTVGYIADPIAKPPRPLTVFYALCDNIEWENQSTKHIRNRETDIIANLRQRHKELTEPLLEYALFDTEKNEEAKRGWRAQEAKKAEVTEREKGAEIDPLAPYLARMFGTGRGAGLLSYKEAAIIREQCICDFKARMLARQSLVQERFDTLNTEYKNKKLWYLANQFILTPEKESAYFVTSAELAFKVHTLEVRLTRHGDLSAPRLRALEDYLDKHPLLKEYNRKRHYNYYGTK